MRKSAAWGIGLSLLLMLLFVFFLAPRRSAQAQQTPAGASGRWILSTPDDGGYVGLLQMQVQGSNVSGSFHLTPLAADPPVSFASPASGRVTPQGAFTIKLSGFSKLGYNDILPPTTGVLNLLIGNPANPTNTNPTTGTASLHLTGGAYTGAGDIQLGAQQVSQTNRLWDNVSTPFSSFSPSEVYSLDLGGIPLNVDLSGVNRSEIVGNWKVNPGETGLEAADFRTGLVSAVNLALPSQPDLSVLTLHDETGALDITELFFDRFSNGQVLSTRDWHVAYPAKGVTVRNPATGFLASPQDGKITLVRR